MLVRLKKISTRIISTWEGELLEFNGESDHVHLLLSIPPKVAPSALSLVAVLPSVFLNNILNNKVKISPR
jgi:REP element-mobilizing transposase RayT